MRGNDLTLCEWNYLLDNKQELTFTYTNWKNDTRQRKVGSPMSIEYIKDIVTGKQIGRAHV